MKKIFWLFVIFSFFISQPAFCAKKNTSKNIEDLAKVIVKIKTQQRLKDSDYSVTPSRSNKTGSGERVRRQKLIREIGYNLLNSNEIDKRMTFSYSLDYKDPNAYATLKTRRINVNKGLFDMIDYDDELAFILGHEISHAIDSYWGPANGLFYNPQFNFVHRRIESRCDLRSIDFMVKAGYNPIAGLIIMNKLSDQPITDYFRTHPIGTKRLATMYVYIRDTYPDFLKDNELVKNPVYKNFLITCKKDIDKIDKKLQDNRNKEIQTEN
ncbi:MAG: M48 family metallopeptidase [bacterium]|nr:M48 family metallopeptidase [bacterium]